MFRKHALISSGLQMVQILSGYACS